jgi:hypothetical protein
MKKLKKLFKIFTSLWHLGNSLTDKVALIRLYLSYPLANRGWYSYTYKAFELEIKLNNQIRKLFLRDLYRHDYLSIYLYLQ